MSEICFACGSDKTELAVDSRSPLTYRGVQLYYTTAFYRCQQCGEEFLTYEQARQSDQNAAAARREFDRLLSPDEIKAIRTRLSLTQEDAARIFGGGKNAFSKYERGEVMQSIAMDRLLRLIDKHPEQLQELTELS